MECKNILTPVTIILRYALPAIGRGIKLSPPWPPIFLHPFYVGARLVLSRVIDPKRVLKVKE